MSLQRDVAHDLKHITSRCIYSKQLMTLLMTLLMIVKLMMPILLKTVFF